MGKPFKAFSHRHSVRYATKNILIANVPSSLTYALGLIIFLYVGVMFGLLYLIFTILALVLFLKFVCTYCPSYGSKHCPSGYGRIAARLFKKGDVARFPQMFKRYIPFLSLIWIFPILGSAVLLLRELSAFFVALTVSFIIVGFVILPLFHRYYECRDCPNREKCPWAK